MSNIFYGHAPLKSGLFLLNLDRGDTHIHNIDAKICKVDNESATYLRHCRLGHIGVKRLKKLLLGNVACNFKKFPTLTQDLSRRCIATRGGECVYVPS